MLSKINPEKKDWTEQIKNRTLTTNVGILPTNPVFKYSANTGIKNPNPNANKIIPTIEKNANGL